MEAGDLYLADLNEETPRVVAIVSDARFARLSGRVLVAPHVDGPPDEVPYPWRVAFGGRVFALDRLRSITVARLLVEQGRLPRHELHQIGTALRAMA